MWTFKEKPLAVGDGNLVSVPRVLYGGYPGMPVGYPGEVLDGFIFYYMEREVTKDGSCFVLKRIIEAIQMDKTAPPILYVKSRKHLEFFSDKEIIAVPAIFTWVIESEVD